MVCLHALQEVFDHYVGVTVVAVLYLAPLAEQRISLVEKENPVIFLGCIEEPFRFFSVSPMYSLMTAERSIR